MRQNVHIFAEKPAGHRKPSQMWPEIMRQNVHISLKSQLDIINVLEKIL
jgi:hypothetical protein